MKTTIEKYNIIHNICGYNITFSTMISGSTRLFLDNYPEIYRLMDSIFAKTHPTKLSLQQANTFYKFMVLNEDKICNCTVCNDNIIIIQKEYKKLKWITHGKHEI